MAAGNRRRLVSRPRLIRMQRLSCLALLLVLTGCAGFEDSVRDINRNLYRTWSGNDTRAARTPDTGSGSTETTPCFSADTGLLYVSQTGRCAAGYAAVPIAEAERAFGGNRSGEATRSAPAQLPAATPAQPAVASALCHDDNQGQVFEAASCPPGSRWVTAAEAASLQQAQLAGASWCYFSGRRLLYRSRACRPGDQSLSLAQADAMWDRLAPDRRPRQRPAETAGGVQAVPPVQAAPRGGVSATPLPARQ